MSPLMEDLRWEEDGIQRAFGTIGELALAAADAIATVQDIAAAGKVWGGDDIGEAFAGLYGPNALAAALNSHDRENQLSVFGGQVGAALGLYRRDSDRFTEQAARAGDDPRGAV